MLAPARPTWKHRRVGERLGRYLLGPLLGSGGAASVYGARLEGPRGFKRLLAIKTIHEHLLDDKDFVAMFLDEANLAVRLSHPNIVHTYELGHQGEHLFLAMEYLAGQPLSVVYRRAFERGSPLDYELVAWLGARAADALHYAHELKREDGTPLGIVHRDVSPDNLFVTYDGDVKVIDFGIARAEGRIARTAWGQVKGKFRYMSPEYALGRSFDRTLDLFALAASLYEAALGSVAFDADDDVLTVERLVLGNFAAPRELRSDFPDTLAVILSRALSSEPGARYQDGGALAAALDEFVGRAARDARARLASRMQSLFASERAAEAACLAEFQATAAVESDGSAAREGAIATDMALELQTHVSTVQKPPLKAIVLGVAAVIALVVLGLFRASERPTGVATAATAMETTPANAVVVPATAEASRPPEPVRAEHQPLAPEAAPVASTPVEAASARAAKPAVRTAPVRPTQSPPPADRAKANGERGVIRANPFGTLE